MTKDEFKKLLDGGSFSFRRANQAHSQVPDSIPKRNKAPTLDRANAGETKSVGRPVVRFTGYRIRPCDPDNFAGSCKDLLDCLRHAHLLVGDEPWNIIFQTDQVKVRTRKEERTEIEIIYPP